MFEVLTFQVRAIHDVKGIDMGNNLVRYKAELDFDGRELTRSYLDKHDLIAMLEVEILYSCLYRKSFIIIYHHQMFL
jgi:solute carrier family 30 (zinc transporter), member 9